MPGARCRIPKKKKKYGIVIAGAVRDFGVLVSTLGGYFFIFIFLIYKN
jgi:hypothetical protein